MQTQVHFRLDFLQRARTALAGIVLSGFLAGPAFAIVFQDPQAEGDGLGASQAFDGEAGLHITFADGSRAGCSGSLVGGGAFVVTAAHCLADDNEENETTSIQIFFANAHLDVTATNYIIDPDWMGTISGGGDLALIKRIRQSSPSQAINSTRVPRRSRMS